MNPILNAILSKGFIKAGRGAKSLKEGAKRHPMIAGIGVGALGSALTGMIGGENILTGEKENELSKNRDLLNDQFQGFEGQGEETDDGSSWIKFSHKGEKYEFQNIPEVHEIMADGSLFNFQDTFDELLNSDYIRKVN